MATWVGGEMFWRVLGLFLALCVFHTPVSARTKDYQLTPTTDWQLTDARDSCQLVRTFGVGKEQVVARLIRGHPTPWFDMNLSGEPLADFAKEPAIRIQFGAAGIAIARQPNVRNFGNRPTLALNLLHLGNVDAEKMGADGAARSLDMSPLPVSIEEAVTRVSVAGAKRSVTLDLGSMGPPMAAMRRCTEALVRSWGLDPAEQASLTATPILRGSVRNVLSGNDYPLTSILAGAGAIVRTRLMIDAAGRVTACSIQGGDPTSALSKLTCNTLSHRATFEPARDPAGKAVASYYLLKVDWRAAKSRWQE